MRFVTCASPLYKKIVWAMVTRKKPKKAEPVQVSAYEAGLLLLLSAEPQRVGLQRQCGKLVRARRCGECFECMKRDCGKCANCSDKLKFGGTGKRKQACCKRKCLQPTITTLAT